MKGMKGTNESCVMERLRVDQERRCWGAENEASFKRNLSVDEPLPPVAAADTDFKWEKLEKGEIDQGS